MPSDPYCQQMDQEQQEEDRLFSKIENLTKTDYIQLKEDLILMACLVDRNSLYNISRGFYGTISLKHLLLKLESLINPPAESAEPQEQPQDPDDLPF